MKRLVTFVLLVVCATVTLNAQSDVELETDHTTGYIDGKYPPYFQSVDGVLYATAQYDFGWTLIKYPASKAETEYTILPYTVRIAKGAFQGATALRVINIPSSVKYIGENAFDDCPSLVTLNCYGGKDGSPRHTVFSGNEEGVAEGAFVAVGGPRLQESAQDVKRKRFHPVDIIR